MESSQQFASFYFNETGIAAHTRVPAICVILLLAFCPGTFLCAQKLPDAPQSQSSAQQDQGKAAKNPSPPSGQSGSESADKKQTSAAPEAGKSKSDNNSEPEQSKRLMWVVPNFGAVTANTQVAPMSTREKFTLARNDSFDYSAFVWTGILAFQSYELNSDPELGSGIAGYGRYYWRGFADGVSGTYFTEAIIPAITHEDPRYFTLGQRGFFRRAAYALSRTFITRTDSGGRSFNWSEVGGSALEAGLANAYYPPQERGVSQTFRSLGTQMESAALNNVAKEFWPDIRHKILRRK
ncbi:MAG: hypothetical protein JWN74_1536 [Acidobacteriaceae bacterium]|nr:hypothetical protein [Acidobacteriaceae bacterium]